jgi:hypothetical protein
VSGVTWLHGYSGWGFVITPSCRGRRSKPKTRWNKKWAAGPHNSKTTQRSKRQVRKSDPSKLRWEHPQVKAQAEGGGREKQPEQKQGIKRMPKTRVHSTLCKVPTRFQPTLTTQELQFYSWSIELMITSHFGPDLYIKIEHTFIQILVELQNLAHTSTSHDPYKIDWVATFSLNFWTLWKPAGLHLLLLGSKDMQVVLRVG